MTTLEYRIEIIRLVILLICGAAIPFAIAWFGNRYSKLRETEEKLRNDRLVIYYKILEPYMLLWTPEDIIKKTSKYKKDQQKSGSDLATEKLLTLEYQEACFKLSLVGSDSVMRAFNNLMQAFYNPDKDEEEQGSRVMLLVSVLFLEIRKSLGNDKTKLHSLEMLEWKIEDIRNFKINGVYPKTK